MAEEERDLNSQCIQLPFRCILSMRESKNGRTAFLEIGDQEIQFRLDNSHRVILASPQCAACGEPAFRVRFTPSSSSTSLSNVTFLTQTGAMLTRDHIIPRARYVRLMGTHRRLSSFTNSQTMCLPCNIIKGSELPANAAEVAAKIRQELLEFELLIAIHSNRTEGNSNG